jgi:hypothetical protein
LSKRARGPEMGGSGRILGFYSEIARNEGF